MVDRLAQNLEQPIRCQDWRLLAVPKAMLVTKVGDGMGADV